MERLQKVLAHAGIASRRHIEGMITAGRVVVNGRRVTQLGFKVDPEKDQVAVDGAPRALGADALDEKLYFLLYKPKGVVSTVSDERKRKTVLDLLHGATTGRLYPIGRLDYDSEGALLVTNDGELTQKLLHPSFKVEKTYMVKVKGSPAPAKLDKLRRGIYLEDGPTGPCHIEMAGKANTNTWLKVVLTKGKNRQIRRMFWRIEHPVSRIVRTHFSFLSIDDMKPGQYRPLTKRELHALKTGTPESMPAPKRKRSVFVPRG